MRWVAAIVVACGCWTSTQPAPEPAVTAPPPSVMTARPERFDQSTPRAAIQSFVRAVELERYEVVLRFVPDRYREAMTEEKLREQFANETTHELFETLRKSLDNPIQENGDEATMPYGDRFEVKLVREAGAWRIKDLD